MTTNHMIQPLSAIDLEYCDHMDRAPYSSLLDQFNNAEIGNGQHALTIHREDGLYRHLQIVDLKGGQRRFDIVTWPKYLTIAGERGSYTFFNGADDVLPLFDRQVNPGYWAEKLVSTHPDSIETYDDLRFLRWVVQDFWQRSRTMNQEQTTDWWDSLCTWLLSDWAIASFLNEASVLDALKYVNAPRGHYDNAQQGMWDTNCFSFEYNLAVILAGVRAYFASQN